MARVVVVHGVSAPTARAQMAAVWLPALIDGIERAGGGPVFAVDDVDWVYYGDLLRSGGKDVSSNARLDIDTTREPNDHGDSILDGELRLLQSEVAVQETSRFFGATKAAIAFELKRFNRYFSDAEARHAIQQRLNERVGPDTRVILAHSLGSVVAYEGLRAYPEWPFVDFVTVGSPLGMRIILDRLVPQESLGVKASEVRLTTVRQWVNVFDPNDLFASPGLAVTFGNQVRDIRIDGVAGNPHSVKGYLSSRAVGEAIIDGLVSSLGYVGKVLTEDGIPMGTCFQVSPGILVTSLHALRDTIDEGVTVQVESEQPMVARVLRALPSHDLAILGLDGSFSDSVLGLASTDNMAARGHLTVVAESASDSGYMRSRAFHSTWLGGMMLEGVPVGRLIINNEVTPGMSGAPVLQEDGRVVGVLMGLLQPVEGEPGNLAWMARLQDIAVPIFEETLTRRKRHFGLGDPVVLRYMSDLAHAYRSAGRLAEATVLFEETLTERRRVLGHSHRETLSSVNDLAHAYRSAGRLAEATVLFEETLTERRRVLGHSHPETLSSVNDLAYVYRSAGRLAEATALFEQNVSASIQILGVDHPSTLAARGNLANAYQAAGRWSDAVALLEAILLDRIRVLGHDSPASFASKNNLAVAYESVGRLDEAVVLLEQALSDRRRSVGDDDPGVLISRSNLANSYLSQGRFDDAIEMLEPTLAESIRVLGSDHPDSIVCLSRLASALFSADRKVEAIPLFERTLNKTATVLGSDHPSTIAAQNNLASAYVSVGRLDEAVQIFEKTSAHSARVFGSDHPSTIAAQNNLASAYVSVGRLDEAIQIFERTLTDSIRIFGANHPTTQEVRDNIAAINLGLAAEEVGRGIE